MRSFLRAFTLTLSLGLLFFLALALFGVVGTTQWESGFSSGAFFQVDLRNSTLFAEFLGRSLALPLRDLPDLSPFRPLEILLPPPLRAVIKVLLAR